ncbi:hypothetical protein METH_17745 [Leisingera methylohalidivorans DSM 14336]|uniref:Transposase for insertion sequence element IS21-like C-terminal domain-containing protein n=1 Tax=Leisingera methylohalidivorans DSM 14336 TaxID=999552 RepID=V9VZS0_9RHOB|nr:hypothetical protein METH_17745 [Leisingera methylohalidivorans DSM 14336]
MAPLSATPFAACDQTSGRVSSLALVRYKTNDYSVPVAFGHRDVWIRAYVDQVVIGCGGEIIARHARSYGREDMIFDPIHYRHIPYSEEKERKLAMGAFEEGAPHVVLLAFKGEVPVGLAACSVGEYHTGTDVRIASIQNISVSRSVRSALGGGRVALGLMQAIHRWAKAQEAQEVALHGTSGVGLQRRHKLAVRVGYEFTGGNYVRLFNE